MPEVAEQLEDMLVNIAECHHQGLIIP